MGERADRGLLEAMQGRATATAGDFGPQEVANVLWALAVMGEGVDGSLDGLIDRLAARVPEFCDQFTKEAKSQLHQWLLSCELDLVSGAYFPSGVARVKQEMGKDCLQAFSGQATHDSQLQRDVAAVLRRAVSEVEIKEEYRDARSGHSIDVLVRRRSAAGSTEWAVEVDGPTHFLGGGRTPNGSTLLKRKQLGQMGYTVVPVPFWEWDALRGEEAKRRYLVDKLGWVSEMVGGGRDRPTA
ncbi:RAP domain-containing protein [Baffinella frigidus]|nr:RAP domain-containing protein [Cryptophyta sp. CCMP2293]